MAEKARSHAHSPVPGKDSRDQFTYREARPEDTAALGAIDSSFTTDAVLQVNVADTGLGFTLAEIPTDPPIKKFFPDDSSDSEDDGEEAGDSTFTLLVEDHRKNDPNSSCQTVVDLSGTGTGTASIVGFIRTSFSRWNRRLVIRDIEIVPSHRGRGVGRTLIDLASKRGREVHGAQHVWLEVSNVNRPAIKSYLKMGFQVCGFDLSLYEGTESKGEFAIFMRRGYEAAEQGN